MDRGGLAVSPVSNGNGILQEQVSMLSMKLVFVICREARFEALKKQDPRKSYQKVKQLRETRLFERILMLNMPRSTGHIFQEDLDVMGSRPK